MIRRIVGTLVIAALAVAPASAQLLRLPGQTDSVARLLSLDGGIRSEFFAVLGEYDDEIQARPHDVARRVDRCRFIDEFSYSYEYLSWLDEVYEQGEECRAGVEDAFANHPEVVLFRLESLYGEEQLEAARPYHQSNASQSWTRGQRSRLYSMLATTADLAGDARAGQYALYALELDESADVRIIAAASLIDRGDKAAAVAILRSPFDENTPDERPWYFEDKIRLLALAGDGAGVAEAYAQLRDSAAYYDAGTMAIALRDAGHIDLARLEFEAAVANPGYLVNAALDLFRFELEFGSKAQAAAAYEAMRDAGWGADPLAVNRVALFLEHPTLPWQARDLFGVLGLALALSMIALVALIPVSFVHYRGLARRLANGPPVAAGGLKLRHTWYGMFALGLAGLATAFGIGPVDLLAEGDATWTVETDSTLVAWSVLLEFLIELSLLVPLVWLFARREPPAVTRWSVPRAILFAFLAAVVLQTPLLILWLASPEVPSGLIDKAYIWNILQQVSDAYGVLAAFWLIVVAAPVAEEFLFRGVLLQVFARHISFWAANVVQAFIFAAIHLQPGAIPMLFLVGLIAGFLARRSGGLLAPMLLHAIFNLLAGLYFLA